MAQNAAPHSVQPTAEPVLQDAPRLEWRCFHCSDLFCDEDDARDHFGPDTEWKPGCVDPLTKDEKDRRHDQVAMYQELDGERQKNSELMDRDYVLSCFERDLAKMFDGAKSVTQAYLVLDSMEGRALAAEEQAASLKARAEQSVDVLESNAREQAKLLADTGRRVEELEAGDKALRGEIFCLRNIVTDVRVMANAGLLKQFEGAPWLKRARNIDLHHDPVATDKAFRAALAPSTPAVSR